jgi:large subunit ribosomal protein L23
MNPYEIVKKPIITERTTMLRDKYNKYVFDVNNKANKIQIKKAIEQLFNVTVTKINTTIVTGKLRRYGKFSGYRQDWKKAIVTLKKGNEIKIIEQSR